MGDPRLGDPFKTTQPRARKPKETAADLEHEWWRTNMIEELYADTREQPKKKPRGRLP